MTETVFKGFTDPAQRQVALPEAFFRELLVLVDSLGELKLVLYLFWRLDKMEGDFRYLRRQDFLDDENFMSSLAAGASPSEEVLDKALQSAVVHGALLSVYLTGRESEWEMYFLNNPRGQAAVDAIRRGEWRLPVEGGLPVRLQAPPNIFELYEQNIGLLTPLIADALREAEKTYPPEWIEEAVQIAVERNARSWRYVNAILERWQQEGRHERKDRRDTAQARRRYTEWGERE